jgi:hypothetical protein
LNEYINGLTIVDEGDLLCLNSGWDCADLAPEDVRALRDYLTEWLEKRNA